MQVELSNIQSDLPIKRMGNSINPDKQDTVPGRTETLQGNTRHSANTIINIDKELISNSCMLFFFFNYEIFHSSVLPFLDKHHIKYIMYELGCISINMKHKHTIESSGFKFAAALTLDDIQIKYQKEREDYKEQIRAQERRTLPPHLLDICSFEASGLKYVTPSSLDNTPESDINQE